MMQSISASPSRATSPAFSRPSTPTEDEVSQVAKIALKTPGRNSSCSSLSVNTLRRIGTPTVGSPRYLGGSFCDSPVFKELLFTDDINARFTNYVDRIATPSGDGASQAIEEFSSGLSGVLFQNLKDRVQERYKAMPNNNVISVRKELAKQGSRSNSHIFVKLADVLLNLNRSSFNEGVTRFKNFCENTYGIKEELCENFVDSEQESEVASLSRLCDELESNEKYRSLLIQPLSDFETCLMAWQENED